MLTISIDEGGRWFKPGETINGTVEWFLDDDVDEVEVRLFWFTSGKGTRDVEVVARVHVEQPGRNGNRSFSFRVPTRPYSFSGSLITLTWGIELVALPGGETERLDLVIGPRPVEVQLT
jgi:hypothetical protein